MVVPDLNIGEDSRSDYGENKEPFDLITMIFPKHVFESMCGRTPDILTRFDSMVRGHTPESKFRRLQSNGGYWQNFERNLSI